MKLSRKRQIFSRRFAELIVWARRKGYEAAIDEVRRGRAQATWNAEHCRVQVSGKRCEGRPGDRIHLQPDNRGRHRFRAIGIRTSLHRRGLAGDLLLYRRGAYLTQSEDYEELGVRWEGFSREYDGEELEFAWGGRFQDGGHFSIVHGGRR